MPEDLAGRAGGARPDPDEDRRGALLHQREGRLGIGRVADRHRDRHVPGEIGERERVVVGGEVAGARHLALDQEEVGAVLGAERPEAPRAPGSRATAALTGRVDFRRAERDQVLTDRLPVRLGEDRLDVAVGCRRDPLEHAVRVVVARLDALEVEDGEPAEPGERAGQSRVDDGIHRRGQDRDRELDAAERLGELDVGGLDRVGAGRE